MDNGSSLTKGYVCVLFVAICQQCMHVFKDRSITIISMEIGSRCLTFDAMYISKALSQGIYT